MKTLMSKSNIKITVAQLDGYLQALRDLNDDHSQRRYWFSADLLSVKNKKVTKIIKTYLKQEDISIKEIELCLKIDKTTEFNTLASKDKKRITKQIKS